VGFKFIKFWEFISGIQILQSIGNLLVGFKFFRKKMCDEIRAVKMQCVKNVKTDI
jgi:hypothetical protein